MFGITLAVTVLERADLQLPQMFTKSVANQGGSIPFRSPRGTVSRI
jgi:hypothetical protein